jgi:YidC/Oxa1 family membrane protein insertase
VLAWLYLPVSFLLATWHDAAALLTGPGSGLGWALAVVGLVLTVRALLLWPAVAQMRTGRAMARLQPELTALRERHRADPSALARATTDLQRAHGVRPLATLGPLLLQIPVMLGAAGVLHRERTVRRRRRRVVPARQDRRGRPGADRPGR